MAAAHASARKEAGGADAYCVLERDDGRIGYYDVGRGPAVVLLHACGTGARSLQVLASRLASHRRVIYPDLDGYGQTAVGNPGDDALARHRSILPALIDALALERFDLIGHSMGGYLALQAVSEGQATPRSMVLVEPTLFGVLDDAVPDQAEAKALDRAITGTLVDAVAAHQPERGMAAFTGLWNDVPWEALPEGARRRLVALAPQVARESALVCADATPAAAYSDVGCPLLLLQGEHAPRPIAALMPVLAAVLPAARLQRVEGAGHMGPVVLPERFADVVESFWEREAA